jgi:hypothetical protein
MELRKQQLFVLLLAMDIRKAAVTQAATSCSTVLILSYGNPAAILLEPEQPRCSPCDYLLL